MDSAKLLAIRQKPLHFSPICLIMTFSQLAVARGPTRGRSTSGEQPWAFGELTLSSEHAIDRSAHLFQNKSRRHATHDFELIRLAWTNFKSIGLHAFDGDFDHVVHLHDGNAFHFFKIKVTQEFGLCRRRC